jgi:hypothetical protein
MRTAQTLTVDNLFEHCDIFIDADDDAWTLIVANPKARAVVDALIDISIDWNFGTPLQEWWTSAPADWRAVDLNLRKLEQEGRLSRLPKLGNVETSTNRYTLQVAVAAKKAGLRVVTYDERTGWQTINLQDENNVIDLASVREAMPLVTSRTFTMKFGDLPNMVDAVFDGDRKNHGWVLIFRQRQGLQPRRCSVPASGYSVVATAAGLAERLARYEGQLAGSRLSHINKLTA